MKKHWAIWFWNVLLFSTLPTGDSHMGRGTEASNQKKGVRLTICIKTSCGFLRILWTNWTIWTQLTLLSPKFPKQIMLGISIWYKVLFEVNRNCVNLSSQLFKRIWWNIGLYGSQWGKLSGSWKQSIWGLCFHLYKQFYGNCSIMQQYCRQSQIKDINEFYGKWLE